MNILIYFNPKDFEQPSKVQEQPTHVAINLVQCQNHRPLGLDEIVG